MTSRTGSGFAAHGQKLVIDSGAGGDMEKHTFYRDFRLGLEGASDPDGNVYGNAPVEIAIDTEIHARRTVKLSRQGPGAFAQYNPAILHIYQGIRGA